MWTVQTPECDDLEAQLDAALFLKDGTVVHPLSGAERAALHALYATYDERLGEPHATLMPLALAACADALHDAYGQVQKGKRLQGMRDRLLSAVIECPLCGSGPATTLDHHLPRGTYRALAINPRNLIPSCQPCNRAKGTLQPVAGQGMIHAYYQLLPTAPFLTAEVEFDGATLDVRFGIDMQVTGPALGARLAFQLDRLQLNARYRDAVNILMFSLKPAFGFLRAKPQEQALLRAFLIETAATYEADFGSNHWRTAVIRGLAVCDAFTANPWNYFDKPPPALHPG